MSRGLHYWLPFEKDGVKGLAYGGHPSCFGFLPTVSHEIPKGATILPYLYLSTDFTEGQWEHIYAALCRSVPIIEVQGKEYPAPHCEFIQKASPVELGGYTEVREAKYGSSYEMSNAIMKVHLPIGMTNYEVYAYIKYYCKLLSLPFSKKVQMGAQMNPYDALKIASDTIESITGKKNFMASYFAISLANQMIGYSFPSPMMGVYCDVLKEHLSGKVAGWFIGTGTEIRGIEWAGAVKNTQQIVVGSSYGMQKLECSNTPSDPRPTLQCRRWYSGSNDFRGTTFSGTSKELVEHQATVIGNFIKEYMP